MCDDTPAAPKHVRTSFSNGENILALLKSKLNTSLVGIEKEKAQIIATALSRYACHMQLRESFQENLLKG